MKEVIRQIIDQYELTERWSVHLAVDNDKEPGYLSTKVGGTPFLLNDGSIPMEGGEYLKLAVQINFSDLPQLEGYPEEGLLQFWIGDLNRSNFENYRTVYYSPKELGQGLDEDQAQTLYLDPDETTGMYPMLGSFSLKAEENKAEYMPNYIFEELDPKYLGEPDIFDYFHSRLKGTKVGGYAFTYMCEVCELVNEEKPLLLQVDSMEAEEGSLIWPDLGIGHLSISQEDLANLNFEDVKFYWDSMEF